MNPTAQQGAERAADTPRRWAIVASRFNEAVVDRLLEGAIACLAGHGVGDRDIDVSRVAGAFEVPQAVARLVERGPSTGDRHVYRGVVALAAIVRGETPHFDYICAETTRALMDLALRSGVPIGFGVLTCDTLAQARARAGGDRGNKGWEAAAAAFQLAQEMDALETAP